MQQATCDGGGYSAASEFTWNAEDAWVYGDLAFYEKAERIKAEAQALRDEVPDLRLFGRPYRSWIEHCFIQTGIYVVCWQYLGTRCAWAPSGRNRLRLRRAHACLQKRLIVSFGSIGTFPQYSPHTQTVSALCYTFGRKSSARLKTMMDVDKTGPSS